MSNNVRMSAVMTSIVIALIFIFALTACASREDRYWRQVTPVITDIMNSHAK